MNKSVEKNSAEIQECKKEKEIMEKVVEKKTYLPKETYDSLFAMMTFVFCYIIFASIVGLKHFFSFIFIVTSIWLDCVLSKLRERI